MPYSPNDLEVIEELRGRGRVFLHRPYDDEWLAAITSRPDLLVSQAVDRGSLFHLEGGRYLARAEEAKRLKDVAPLEILLAARLDPQPVAVAYRSALHHHGLADMEGKATFAVEGLPGPRVSLLAGQKVRLVRLAPERFFGHDEVEWQAADSLALRSSYKVTNLERTLVDCLDKPRLCGEPELVARAWAEGFRQGADAKRVARYAQDLGHSATRRAAFWLDRVGHSAWAQSIIRDEIDHEEALAERHRLPGRVSRGKPEKVRQLLHPVLLDSTQTYASKGTADPDYGVVVNLPARVLDLAG